MAAPSVMARTNARPTRASVAPRLRNSAPERASAMTAASTVGGGGSDAAPANSAAIHQGARNTMNDRRGSTSVSRDRVIECPEIKSLRGSDQFATADRGQHAIERARVGFFVDDATVRNSLSIT